MNQITKQPDFSSLTSTSYSHVPARLIDVYWSHPVALSTQVSLEIIETPEILKVPGSKCYLDGLMNWQDRWIPAINLKALLTGKNQKIDEKYALVVLYRYPNSKDIHYGAILLNKISTIANIGNELTANLPDNSKMWPLIADACFNHEGQTVPILNMQSIFCYSFDWSK